MPSTDDVRELGKSIARLHMKLGAVETGLQASIDRLAGAPPPTSHEARSHLPARDVPASGRSSHGGDDLDTLLDLLDAVDGALQRREQAPAPDLPRRRRLFGRRTEGTPRTSIDSTLWQGLAVASAAAHDRLARAGVEIVPVTGPLDARLHRVVETVDADPDQRPSSEPTIERTLRRGWFRRGGERPEVVRTAQVVARHPRTS